MIIGRIMGFKVVSRQQVGIPVHGEFISSFNKEQWTYG